MKNTYTIEERNRIVEEQLWCIKAVIKQNRALIDAFASAEYLTEERMVA